MPREADDGGGGGGAAAWVRRWWRALVGELVATALLVLLGVGSLLPHGEKAEAPPLTHPALGFGFIVTANVQAFGAVSGAHMNPAVTLAALLHGRVGAGLAAAYVAAQLVGAVGGFALLRAAAPAAALASGAAGVTAPAAGVSAAAAVLVEALLTGTLALVACGVWAAHDPARPDHSAPLKFGLAVAGLVYAGGFLTGASLNPARSLAPALLQGAWQYQWVYWVGPLLGAALGALLHRWVLLPPATLPRPRPRLTPPQPEDLPLHDKRDH